MNFSFHPSAEQELNEGVDYYNQAQDGLGLQFTKEVYNSIQNILSFPYGWTPLSENTRRCLVNRFPFGVIYQIEDDQIIIIAVMQLNKKPEFWKDRIDRIKGQ
ncbi:type II toxin-antitoxin system RelE/ParE family toxin [Myxococcota bacterium]|nr:type II toxin-antitoxin system RelE/ParE family toxin [Myxococcota bacterium]MBU1379322.1 type II toxin-antitoxin system RelE/ParE family toxin [Myxococcota bacterium]MBU1497003.1 type II toxin-antitoxin system RelE/ParE family toxin [Myxococcota bacterium]